MILFDEIEKAHPQIFSIFLQILDDGRLTDGQGRIVNFKNTVIIMTSNLGSEYLTDESLNKEDIDSKIHETLRHFFRPEFLNRVDQIIIFNKLGKEEIRKIVDLRLDELSERLMQKGYVVQFDESIRNYIASFGFDEAYGARPIKRIIQNKIEDELALEIIEGKINSERQVIVSYNKGLVAIH